MKLLLDENLPPQLVGMLAGLYPGIRHVHDLSLGAVDDSVIWEYAANHGFTIVTKDSDFAERALAESWPPKVIWLRLGNCTNARVEAVLRSAHESIRAFTEEADDACLEVGRVFSLPAHKPARA